jgi:tellurite resistance protein TerC
VEQGKKHMEHPLWMWGAFLGLVLALLALDLGVLNKKDREIGVRESLVLSSFYIAVSLLFSLWVWHQFGAESASLYLTGYVVEKALALDNIFVISLVFSYFAIPRMYQHRVLFWGILGVIILRGIMIGLGTALITQFAWILYVFAAFLVYTGFKMLFMSDDAPDISNNFVLKYMKKHFRTTDELYGHDFFVKKEDPKNPGQMVWFMTPLFVALVVIEFVDVIFAVDSVPAIFALTNDPYIIYTSNIFAILGLRSLYFALAAMIHRFEYLKQALALVLVFIGGKVFVADLLGLDKVPAPVSLSITFALILGGVLYSLYKTNQEEKRKLSNP